MVSADAVHRCKRAALWRKVIEERESFNSQSELAILQLYSLISCAQAQGIRF